MMRTASNGAYLQLSSVSILRKVEKAQNSTGSVSGLFVSLSFSLLLILLLILLGLLRSNPLMSDTLQRANVLDDLEFLSRSPIGFASLGSLISLLNSRKFYSGRTSLC